MPGQNTVEEILRIVVRDEDFKAHQRNVEGYGRKSQGAFRQAGSAATTWLKGAVVGAALAAAAALAKATVGAAKFSAQMAQTGALTGASRNEIRALRREVIELHARIGGGDLPQYARSLYDIRSAGHLGAASMKLLAAAGRLAVAANTDIANSTDILTSALNAYDLEAEQALRVSDLLYATQRAGKVDVQQVSASFGRLAPNARAAGVAMAEALGLIAALTSVGVAPNEAITQINALLAAIDRQRKEIKALGIDASRTRIEEEGLVAVLLDLQEATRGQASALTDLLKEQNAVRAVNGLMSRGAGELRDTLDSVENSAGAVGDAYARMKAETTTLAEQMKNEFVAVLTTIGLVVLPAVNLAIKAVIVSLRYLRGGASAVVSGHIADAIARAGGAAEYLADQFERAGGAAYDYDDAAAAAGRYAEIQSELESIEGQYGGRASARRHQLTTQLAAIVDMEALRVRRSAEAAEAAKKAAGATAEAAGTTAEALAAESESIANLLERARSLREEAERLADPERTRELTQQAIALERQADAMQAAAERPPPPADYDPSAPVAVLSPDEIAWQIELVEELGGALEEAAERADDLHTAVARAMTEIGRGGRIGIGVIDEIAGATGGLSESLDRVLGGLDRVFGGVGQLGLAAATGDIKQGIAGMGKVLGGLIRIVRSGRAAEEKRIEAAREAARRSAELARAMRESARRIATAVDRLREIARYGSDLTEQEQERARFHGRQAGIEAESIRREPESSFIYGFDFRRHLAQLAELGVDGAQEFLDLYEQQLAGGATHLEAINALFNEGLGQWLDQFSRLGEIANTVPGAIRELDIFLEFLGGDLTEGLQAFVDRLLRIDGLDPVLEEWLKKVQSLDLSTPEGRKELEAIIAYIAARPDVWGNLTAGEIFSILGTLQRGAQIDTPSRRRETRDVRTARQITEITGSQLVAIAREELLVLRQILAVLSGPPGAVSPRIAFGSPPPVMPPPGAFGMPADVGAPTSPAVGGPQVNLTFDGNPSAWTEAEVEIAAQRIGRATVDEVRRRLGTLRTNA